MNSQEMNAALLTLGKKIYTARKAMKMSRAELGKLVGLHETTVKRYEDGNIKSPNLEKIKAFAAALQIEYQYLVEELLCGVPEDFQQGVLLGFSSLDDFHNWTSIMEKFDRLNESGKTKALEFLDLLTTHPDYVIVLEPIANEFEEFHC